jgi:cytochrome c-type biogenesis protein CcmH/NrfG
MAAAHAFSESLARDPDNPDTYYDLGIALEAGGNMSAAEAAYRHASHLRTTSAFRREKQEWAPASTSMRASHVQSPR